MTRFPELEQVRITVDGSTKAQHLAAIDAELIAVKIPPRRRFRLFAVAVTTLLLLPVIALAAERAQPGDLFYPVRQLVQGPDPIAEVDDRYFAPDPDVVNEVPEDRAGPSQDATDPVADRVAPEPSEQPADGDRVRVKPSSTQPASREGAEPADSSPEETDGSTTTTPERERRAPDGRGSDDR